MCSSCLIIPFAFWITGFSQRTSLSAVILEQKITTLLRLFLSFIGNNKCKKGSETFDKDFAVKLSEQVHSTLLTLEVASRPDQVTLPA